MATTGMQCIPDAKDRHRPGPSTAGAVGGVH